MKEPEFGTIEYQRKIIREELIEDEEVRIAFEKQDLSKKSSSTVRLFKSKSSRENYR
ncbi:hypothetical protein [Heyndrickxia ginsengihumi]|uniref:hypothetical protein n=1 Tax=Heyndrickxia ginsengihumi TaxID=363870 RepID=UPI0004B75BA6|nr:hypothetical protein [Heyndrickxia ginsengihumi]